MKKVFILICLLCAVGGIGCAAISYYITPAKIDQKAVEYVVDANVATLEDFGGYQNLLKAEKLKKDVEKAHSTIQFDLQQKAEKDNLKYNIHRDVVSNNFVIAQQTEEMLFGEKGLLSLGLSVAGFGTLTGFIGLMRKRPGDITTQEMETALAQATEKTNKELSAKEKQFIQLVKGVHSFISSIETQSPDVVEKLKSAFDKTQDLETKVAVCAVKNSEKIA